MCAILIFFSNPFFYLTAEYLHIYLYPKIFYHSLFTSDLHSNVIPKHKNLIILVVNIYCEFMLCCNNVCLQFTDIILLPVTVDIIPNRSQDHFHAVSPPTRWRTKPPVCIVQCCPITPFPGSLLHTTVRKLYSITKR